MKKRNRDRLIGMIALTAAGIMTGGMLQTAGDHVQVRMQQQLAEEVLRFHVLANSDSEADQNLKKSVRDRILQFLDTEMPEDLSAEETKEWMRRHCDTIEDLSREILKNQGADYPVTAAVTTTYFPEKQYRDLTFPAGNYEALRVEIGSAKGHNWWCMLYPQLAFADAVRLVTEEEVEKTTGAVIPEETEKPEGVKFKFYFLEAFR